MHAVSFWFKRAHWSAVRVGKQVLAKAKIEGMTPARFDLLYMMRRERIMHRNWNGGFGPSDVAHVLGVHVSTASKMMKRLVEMGWLSRTYDVRDGRRTTIKLTALGLAKITQAMRLLFRQREMLWRYEELFPSGPRGHVVERIHRVVQTLAAVAYAFGDRAKLWFDYGSKLENRPLIRHELPRYIRLQLDADYWARTTGRPPPPCFSRVKGPPTAAAPLVEERL